MQFEDEESSTEIFVITHKVTKIMLNYVYITEVFVSLQLFIRTLSVVVKISLLNVNWPVLD